MRDILRSEWIKLMSIRSTPSTLAVAAFICLAGGLAATASDVASWPAMTTVQRTAVDPVQDSILGAAVAQIAFGVFGVLAVTSEYASGTIRTSVAAVPERRRLMAGKATVTGGVALVFATLLVAGSFFLGQAVLSQRSLQAGLSTPGALRSVLYAGCYSAVVALIGYGLGLLLHHTAAAITALVAVIFLIPQISQTLPGTWADRIGEYLPYNAARSATSTHRVPHTLTPTWSLLVCAAYALVPTLAGIWLIERRDT
ncbi:ABC-2 type transport system permease protein [Catenulispora sp. GAS73]|uniref:ABC transporter permease n=1 Tax=Catenulispora sp. GAS73 TaxID=3156269 RepID=UPI003517D639